MKKAIDLRLEAYDVQHVFGSKNAIDKYLTLEDIEEIDLK